MEDTVKLLVCRKQNTTVLIFFLNYWISSEIC